MLVDINGGVDGVVDGLEVAMKDLDADLLVGLDVGGDSLAQGEEPGLRSPLADSIMLAALTELEKRGHRTIWGVFGYGSDGELTVDEIELALSKLAAAGGSARRLVADAEDRRRARRSHQNRADGSQRDPRAMLSRRLGAP